MSILFYQFVYRFVATVQSILLNGMLPDDLDDPPYILSVTCRNNRPFISVSADIVPVNGSCDAKITANVEAISVVFDAVRFDVLHTSVFLAHVSPSLVCNLWLAVCAMVCVLATFSVEAAMVRCPFGNCSFHSAAARIRRTAFRRLTLCEDSLQMYLKFKCLLILTYRRRSRWTESYCSNAVQILSDLCDW